MRYQGPQNGRKAGQADHGGDEREQQKHAVLDFSKQSPVHRPAAPCRSSLRSMACAAAITVKVMKNNNKPSAMSDEVYKSPTASVNSLAIADEMVVPGASNDELMRCALPMTKVTA